MTALFALYLDRHLVGMKRLDTGKTNPKSRQLISSACSHC
ncbi:hypothetical protein HMPREF9065_01331 [Aggregatibacter sp. oral taxon 458 str. W10330]|nr:hypothetical protein HMPREF9065_01331 [Aggregatibacter sp. oral taxon 458 str. W10330]